MMTGNCCHLPGSLCNCSDNPVFSKVVEATSLGSPQHVAQVTSRNGPLFNFGHTERLPLPSSLP
uniref:Uncharacterized protein n=1 Tax=Peromyscus maniculatus bairdii TaxID=230844 RepID=A0A8C8W4B1_PERMB